MKHIFLLVFLFFTSFCMSQNGDLKVEIERIILHDTDISLDDTPGFVIGIIDNDSTYFVEFGTKIKGEKIPLSNRDVFEVGSITKVLTASLVSVLEEEGLVSVTDKVNKYLPLDFQNPRMDDVSMLDLIHHTSGLPVRPYMFGTKEKDPQDPYAFFNKSDLLHFYTQFVPKNKGEFNYSHTNYALLEIILEYATGKSMDFLMKQYVLDPIGMDDSFVFFREKKIDVVTQGYDRAGRETEPWSFASFGGSEGLRTSAEDLVEFIKVNLGTIDHPYSTSFEKNHSKEVDTNFNEAIKMGRGWQIIDQRKRFDIITHNGKTNGHNAFVGFVKETNTGVVVLSNSNVGTRDLGFLILRMINFNWKRKA